MGDKTRPRPKRRKRRSRRADADGKEISLLLANHAMDRALERVFENAAAKTRTLVRRQAAPRGLYFTAREQLAHGLIRSALGACGGDVRLAARLLGISISTIKAAAPVHSGTPTLTPSRAGRV